MTIVIGFVVSVINILVSKEANKIIFIQDVFNK